jgi:hypothetical protein
MRYEALSTAHLTSTPLRNTNIMAGQNLDVLAKSLILSKYSIHGHNTTYSPLIDLFYTGYEKLGYQITAKLDIKLQQNLS